MNIIKLPSDHYRIREMKDGKRYTVTVPYKPSRSEAADLIKEKIEGKMKEASSFITAATNYIKVKKNVLSPSTYREYTRCSKNLPEHFKNLDINKIDNYELQKLVDEYSVDHAPKTTRNMYGFVRAVIRFYNPDTNVCATLPQNRRKEPYTPTVDDVKKILDYAKGSDYYVPLYLATLSLRCSEICALTIDDLKGDEITVSKAYVRGENGYVLKDTPKTDASYRTVMLPKHLAKEIRKQGYIFNYLPNQLDKYLTRVQKRLNIPHFGIHRLRHFFVSYSHSLGYSDSAIQAAGGWQTDYCMKAVYRHELEKDKTKKALSKDFTF